MKIEIIRAVPADVDAIRFLFRDTVLFVNSKDYTPEEITVWADHYKDTDTWLKKINEQHFLTAQIENYTVGFSSITDKGHLDFLYTHKDFQKHGIATTLLKSIEKQAEKLNLRSITTHSSKTAKGFFEKQGYIKRQNHLNRVKNIDFINSVMVKNTDRSTLT